MSNKVLEKYSRVVVPVNVAGNVINEYRERLKNDQSGARQMTSHVAGDVILFIWDRYPQWVMEIVLGARGEDCAIAFYHSDSIFNDINAYERMRQNIIYEIAGLFSALPSSIRFDDGRDRKNLEMKEMGTAQLLDELARLTYSSI